MLSTSLSFKVAISPLSSPSDFETLVPIQYAAFHPNDPTHRLFFPAPEHPLPREIIERTIERRIESLEGQEEGGARMWDVAYLEEFEDGKENETAEKKKRIVGGIKSIVFADGGNGSDIIDGDGKKLGDSKNSESAWQRRYTSPINASWITPHSPSQPFNIGPGVHDQDYITYLMNQLFAIRTKHIYGPGILLDALFVDPTVQRKGVGRKLIREVTRRADEFGLRTWVEASWRARGVYEREGFVVVEGCVVGRRGERGWDGKEEVVVKEGDEGWKDEWDVYSEGVSVEEGPGCWFMVREPIKGS